MTLFYSIEASLTYDKIRLIPIFIRSNRRDHTPLPLVFVHLSASYGTFYRGFMLWNHFAFVDAYAPDSYPC